MFLLAFAFAFGLATQAVPSSQAAPSPKVRPEQFDLNCNGHSELQLYDFGGDDGGHYPTFMKKPKSEAWTGTFRVDLKRNIWCQDKCTEVFGPAIAKPNIVVLVESDRRGVRQRTTFETPDGTMLQLQADGTSIIPVRAKCSVSEFTKIPDNSIRVGGTLDMKAEPYPLPSR